MSKLNKLTVLIISSIFFVSCNSKMFEVRNIKKVNTTDNRLVYSLPKTVIVVEVELNTISKHKGPFYMYAKTYLGGARDVIMGDETTRDISGINILSYSEPDTNNIYSIKYGKNYNIHNINLTSKGFLAGINLTDFESDFEQENITESFMNSDSEVESKLSYTDYTLEPALETRYDTLYKEVFVDSAYIKVPVIHKKLVNKTVETQAKELADQIFLLRDDKNALLKGENDGDIFPEGEALTIMLKELSKLESDYMSLFTGHTESTKRVYRFEYHPDSDENNIEVELFRLSRKYGILPVGDINGKPVIIKITRHDFTKPVNSYENKKNSVKGISASGLMYRIPDEANIEILIGEYSVARRRISIAQFGTINVLPKEIFTDESKVEFYPDYGSLKSISK